ncbi:hypothetical protein [Microbulbifer sp. JMSA003]|uniref:hypothetical protein n=1 Tax=Microbulbifer sp. JMSA003 TaxID=3243369 RepID=UPI004039C567
MKIRGGFTLLTGVILLASCTKESDPRLVGKWTSYERVYMSSEKTEPFDKIKYTFNKDGTGEMFMVGDKTAQEFKYDLVDNTVKLSCFCSDIDLVSLSATHFESQGSVSVTKFKKLQ